jgi:hypothetical protein
MSDIKKKFNISVHGVMTIEDGRIIMSIEDLGDMPLDVILEDFDGREIKITANYDEDYDDYTIVNTNTGEVID